MTQSKRPTDCELRNTILDMMVPIHSSKSIRSRPMFVVEGELMRQWHEDARVLPNVFDLF